MGVLNGLNCLACFDLDGRIKNLNSGLDTSAGLRRCYTSEARWLGHWCLVAQGSNGHSLACHWELREYPFVYFSGVCGGLSYLATETFSI